MLVILAWKISRGRTVLTSYGQEIKLVKLGRPPAQVLVDRSGRACFVDHGHDTTDIPANAAMLALIEGPNVERLEQPEPRG